MKEYGKKYADDFSYTDINGKTRYFAVNPSGEDGSCVFMSSKRGWEVPDVQPGEGYAGRYPQGGTGQTGRPGKEGIKLPLAVRAQHDACFRLRGSASVVK